MSHLSLENYKKENMVLLKEYRRKNGMKDKFIKKELPFDCESILSDEEKIAWMDAMKDGIASYMLSLRKQFVQDLKAGVIKTRNYYGEEQIVTISLVAWLKRNDTRKIVDGTYEYGRYYMFGKNYYSIKSDKAHNMFHNMLYQDMPVVQRWFHDFLLFLVEEERKYFEATDEVSVMLKQLKEVSIHNIDFGCEELMNILWNGKTDVPMEHLEVYMRAYEMLSESIEKIGKYIESAIKRD